MCCCALVRPLLWLSPLPSMLPAMGGLVEGLMEGLVSTVRCRPCGPRLTNLRRPRGNTPRGLAQVVMSICLEKSKRDREIISHETKRDSGRLSPLTAQRATCERAALRTLVLIHGDYWILDRNEKQCRRRPAPPRLVTRPTVGTESRVSQSRSTSTRTWHSEQATL